MPFLLAMLLVALTRPLTDLLARSLPRGCRRVAHGADRDRDRGRPGDAGRHADRERLPRSGESGQLGPDRGAALAGHRTAAHHDRPAGGLRRRLQNSLGSHSGTLISGAFAAAGTVSDVLAGIFITLFSIYFMLAQGDVIWGWMLRVLPDPAQEPMDVAGRRGWVTLTSYIRATVLVAATDAHRDRRRRRDPGCAAGGAAGCPGLPRRLHPRGRRARLRHRRRARGAGLPRSGHRPDHAWHRDRRAAAGSPCAATVPDGSRSPGPPTRRHPRHRRRCPRAGIVGALFAVPIIAVGNTIGSSLAGRRSPNDPVRHEENPVGDDAAREIPQGAADAT